MKQEEKQGTSEKTELVKTIRAHQQEIAELTRQNEVMREALEDVSMLVNHTEELNMCNYDEELVRDMNNSFIAMTERLAQLKDQS